MSEDIAESTSYSEEQEEAQFGFYAMIPNGSKVVMQVIETLNTFKMPGYYFILVADGVTCESGMIYNPADGSFSYPAESETD
ncbi:hypothetical protein CYR55_22300 [Chimaeribacter californicus]|uniref:Uncharacterized protein n=1 Tax=Chimaeribacter californicus TaxID=2060067 RepID=A0A2N5DU37_9GAMM|nr:hypothetical protein [Chimaeribacter californicus]PLR30289.1 hypothetical protein CYR55_22300 [Chimaeribacter californicus]